MLPKMHQSNQPNDQPRISYFYKAIMTATATIPAKTLPFNTLSCAPSLSALFLLDVDDPPDPSPWEKSPLLAPLLVDALPLDDEVALLPEDPLVDEAEELLSDESPGCPSVPGPAPERPGIVAASDVELAPEEAADG